ncbi:penicillin-binding protein 2 [Opitutus sp. ER46]|uniref:peptidoglycan D,D-transpeptidase FtsI family protein n=1 Tax=Opitutus sp. ER46 TaxID=2161864 RepID=UPI000D31176D|nr:penicillin-binding protein 2 [Opitutus sp. ER46]PTX90790.1 penicillin-binding protein 2 [Opitutus sp. ER46]
MSRGFASNYRIVVLAAALLSCFVVVGVRLVHLHVINRDELLRSLAQARRQTARDVARRGDIFDRSRDVRLATSRPMIRVAVDPMLVRPEDKAKLPRLAQLLNLPLAEVTRKFETQYRRIATSAAPANATTSGAPAANALLNLNFAAASAATAKTAEADEGDPAFDPEFAKSIVARNSVVPTAPNDPEVANGEDEEPAPGNTLPGHRAIRYMPLSDAVSESTFAEIEKLGIRAICPPERRYARVYPHNELAAHLVGFANRVGDGALGVEAFADLYLHGQDGWREGEKDGRRREVARFRTHDLPRSDGYSVVMSIDATVQDIIERELDQIARTYEPLKATIIVSEPATGFILGMANYPTFNPNEYGRVPKSEMNRMKNIAVTDTYEPGSVFKIVAASAALEERLVSPDTQFNCSIERIWYREKNVKMPQEDHHFDHPLSVAEIISRSSNRGAAQLAIKVGEEKFEEYAHRFGFGERLGFAFGGEEDGIFKPRKDWRPIDITRMAMGHSIAATALQMHQAMSVIANGGVLMRPQVIREIRDTENHEIYRYWPQQIRRVISPQTARTMALMLKGVASPGGTAATAAIKIGDDDYEVAGKTGTAQKYVPVTLPSGRTKLMPSKKNHVVSFVGFFPASNPQVMISVIVDDADHRCRNGVAYGAQIAAPVFKSIGEKLIPILPITPPNQRARVDVLAAIPGVQR